MNYTNNQNNIHLVDIYANTSAPYIVATADYYGGGRKQYKCCRSLNSALKTAKKWREYSYAIFDNAGNDLTRELAQAVHEA